MAIVIQPRKFTIVTGKSGQYQGVLARQLLTAKAAHGWTICELVSHVSEIANSKAVSPSHTIYEAQKIDPSVFLKTDKSKTIFFWDRSSLIATNPGCAWHQDANRLALKGFAILSCENYGAGPKPAEQFDCDHLYIANALSTSRVSIAHPETGTAFTQELDFSPWFESMRVV